MSSISLRWKLPLLIGGLPLLVAGAVLWVSYGQVRDAALETAEQRLGGALTTVSSRLTGQFRSVERRVHALAAAPQLAEFLRLPTAANHETALSTMPGIRAGTGSTLAVEFRGADGSAVTLDSAAGPVALELALDELRRLATGPDSAGIGVVRAVAGGLGYPVVAQIGGREAASGYLVIWQRTNPGSGEMALVPQLLGSGSSFMIGSTAGLWTDQSVVVPRPDVDLTDHGMLQRYQPAGERPRLVLIGEVDRSPWLLALTMPADSVLAPGRRFLRSMGSVALLVGALGLLAGLTISRRILRPMTELTDAAELMTAGRHDVRVGVEGDDEPARLATAFNAMAARVDAEVTARAGAEAQWRLLFKDNPHPMWVFDRESLGFLAVNEAAMEKYGYSREEFLAMTIQDIRPATEVETLQVELGLSHPVNTGPAAFRHRCKDGRILSTEIRTRALDFDGRPARMVLAEDVTSRLALEAALRQSQKMEAIGRLAGGVAHDFNNFLTVIMTYVELAREGLPASDPRAADLEAVTAAAERAHALTRQLLAFTRQQVVQPVVLDPNEALRPVESMLRRLLGEDITIELRRDPVVGRVRMDPGQFEQVFMNLAVNARDAMPDGGTLTISTTTTDLDEESSLLHGLPAAGRFAVVVVADTGTGMPPEVRARIFEPFFTTKEVGKGTGLGLATVYGIVAQAGGSISLYSEVGMGATFRIYLPEVALDPSGPAVQGPPESAPRGSETILLVEDDAAVRSAAEAVLKRLGYAVLVAPGAAEAIALMAHHAADVHLVVSDVVMPGTDGPTLLEGIQRDYPRVRGLMMSGYAGEVLANRRAMVRGIAFLEKPFTVLALAKKVREVLDRP
jgi:hypothetical protein